MGWQNSVPVIRGGLQAGGTPQRIRHLLTAALISLASVAHAAGPESLFAATLTGSDGKPIDMAAYKGKPLIVNFWARWCTPCRTEIPELIKAHDTYRKQGLVVLGIGLEDDAEAVRDFMKAYEMHYPVVLAKDKGIWLLQALGNSQAGLPFTVAINRQGEIVTRKLGVMKAADIDAAANTLLK